MLISIIIHHSFVDELQSNKQVLRFRVPVSISRQRMAKCKVRQLHSIFYNSCFCNSLLTILLYFIYSHRIFTKFHLSPVKLTFDLLISTQSSLAHREQYSFLLCNQSFLIRHLIYSIYSKASIELLHSIDCSVHAVHMVFS